MNERPADGPKELNSSTGKADDQSDALADALRKAIQRTFTTLPRYDDIRALLEDDIHSAPGMVLQMKPSSEQIAELAYRIWDAEGRPNGRDVAHWLEAEARIRDLFGTDQGDLRNNKSIG